MQNLYCVKKIYSINIMALPLLLSTFYNQFASHVTCKIRFIALGPLIFKLGSQNNYSTNCYYNLFKFDTTQFIKHVLMHLYTC